MVVMDILIAQYRKCLESVVAEFSIEEIRIAVTFFDKYIACLRPAYSIIIRRIYV